MRDHHKVYEIPVQTETVESLVETTRETQRKAGAKILGETRPGFVELAVSAHSYADELMERAAEWFFPPLACAEGCNYCCHIPVNVSIAEVVAIMDYVEGNFSPARRAEIKERIDQRCSQLETVGDRNSVNIRCPLLDDSGACSVYPVRPLACRGFNSTDLEACRLRFEQPGKSVSSPAFGYNVYAAIGVAQGVQLSLKDAGHDPVQLDLIKALEMFWDDPSGVLEEWREGGERALESAERFED